MLINIFVTSAVILHKELKKTPTFSHSVGTGHWNFIKSFFTFSFPCSLEKASELASVLLIISETMAGLCGGGGVGGRRGGCSVTATSLRGGTAGDLYHTSIIRSQELIKASESPLVCVRRIVPPRYKGQKKSKFRKQLSWMVLRFLRIDV